MPDDLVDLRVTSEYGTLQAVMVKRPGDEIERLTTSNKDVYLFEDIPWSRKMQKEHDAFVALLIEQGVEVLDVNALLLELLENRSLMRRLVQDTCYLENCDSYTSGLMRLGDINKIARALIAGIKFSETKSILELSCDTEAEAESFLIPPLPNFYFMRDPAVVIGGSILASNMAKDARVRESLIMRFILENHPRFKRDAKPREVLFGRPGQDGRPFMIEGGDIIVVSDSVIAVGHSERTKPETIRRLATRLFEENVCDKVYEVPIPARRAYMHLDTVFSIIDKDLVLVYPDALKSNTEIRGTFAVYSPLLVESERKAWKTVLRGGFEEFLESLTEELNPGGRLDIAETGGGDPVIADREQFCDATNTFAIAPRKVIAYCRNEVTNSVLRDNGVTVLEIEGSELVRGRGGPRCMTMPLRREDVC